MKPTFNVRSVVHFALAISLVIPPLAPLAFTIEKTNNILPDDAMQARVSQLYGQLPLSFEANHDQSTEQVSYFCRGSDYSLFLTASEAVLTLGNDELNPPNSSFIVQHSSFSALRMKLVGGNAESPGAGLKALPGRINYLIGNDPAQWRRDVSTYAKVKYDQVYPGVDVVYYGNQRQLEYDFIVAPGSDPDSIRLGFEGADKVEVDAQGDLGLQTAGGSVRMHKPVIYQEVEGVRQEIAGGYVLRSAQQVGFEVTEYDTTRPLVIDPVLVYSTYLGGTGNDQARAVAVDAMGNVYVTGNTNSVNFPTVTPLQPTSHGGTCGAGATLAPCSNVFVAKLNASGTALVYSTYLGGNGADQGNAIAVDATGNVYVTGLTGSTNFPTASSLTPATILQAAYGGGTNDVFVAKLNAAGSMLLYSTYVGGSGSDIGLGITVDAAGSAHVTGQTTSTNFPLANAFQTAHAGGTNDAFVAKLNAAGSMLLYSTYVGGSGNNDISRVIAVDKAGNAYITGLTNSPNFPVTMNALFLALPANNTGHGFLTKLDAAGKLAYSTYIGGSLIDDGFGIAVDGNGDIYVAGDTTSTDFPLRNPIQATKAGAAGTFDCFAFKMKGDGSALIYSTYLGGSGTDQPKGMAIDAAGNMYFTANTNSPDIPTVSAVQPTFGGGTCGTAACNDVLVAKLNAAGSRFDYVTYVGGNAADQPLNNGIAVDAAGNVYVIGQSASTNFPVTMNALQPANGGGTNDAFITKIAP